MRVRKIAAATAAIVALGGVAVTAATTSRADTAVTVAGIPSETTISVRAGTVPALAAHAKIGGLDGQNACAQKVSGPGPIVSRYGSAATFPLMTTATCHAGPFVSLAASEIGEYKVRIFADENGNGSFDQGIDRAASLLTVNVADLVPTVDLRAPEDSLGTVTLDGTITFAPQPTVKDIRGTGVLGSAIAALTGVSYGEGPCGTVGQSGTVVQSENVSVTPLAQPNGVVFNSSQKFEFDLVTAKLNDPHNGGTVKVTPTGPEASPLNGGNADVAWLHSAKPASVEVMRLGDQDSPNGKAFPLGDRNHLNSVDLVARVSAPGPVKLECPLVDVSTSEGTWILDGDKAVNSLHAATALINGINHPEIKTVEYVGSDLKFNAVVFTKTGPAKITVRAGDASATITPSGAVATDPYILTAPPVTLEQGKSGILTGTVTDAWGNPVPGTTVELSGVTGGVGVLDVATVKTGSDGTWSGRLAVADKPGTGSYVAQLPGVASAGAGRWLGTTLTVPATVTGLAPSITVGATPEPGALSLAASGALAGQQIRLSGAAPDGQVLITARGAGAPPRTWAVTASGGWTATYPATRTTTFTAQSGNRSTAPVTVVVSTRVTSLVAAQAGSGRVRISMMGQPSASARYWVSVNGKHKIVTSSRQITLQTGKGLKVISVRVTAPGCQSGPARTIRKTVK